jgi:hypothetical protein
MKNKIEKKQEYVTQNSFSIEHMPLSDVIDVSKFVNGADVNLVNYNKQTVISGDKKDTKSFNKQMLLDADSLQKVLEKPYDFDAVVSKLNNPNPIVLVKKEYWDFFQDEGLYAQIGRAVGKEEKRDYNSFTSKNFFDDANNPEYMFVQFRENKNHRRVIMDVQGNLACEPMVFDYIRGHLDNETYDLDNLVEYLMKRDDVAFIAYADSSYKSKLLKCPLSDNDPDLGGIIDDIPGYNADEGRDESITLVYYPKAEVIQKIMDWEMTKDDKNSKIYDLESYIVQEILGCKQFLKHPVVEAEPETPKRKFKR